MQKTLTIRRPDDFHLHLRDGAVLSAVIAQSAVFARAIIMPNLVPPVASAAALCAYRKRIEDAMPEAMSFTPLMTLYLTDDTTPETIDSVAELATAAKLYPAHATTNSASGVTDPLAPAMIAVYERLAARGLLLLIHGEVTDAAVDIFDREARFIDTVLEPLRAEVPDLKIVLEHVSSLHGAAYVRDAGDNLAATITAHHLAIDRNALLAGGIRPHNYCLPILKRTEDRRALIALATSGHPRVFFGSDSAPHTDAMKLAPCGAAGCFTSSVALSILAHVFEDAGALDRLEDYVSGAGARYYGLPQNEGTVTLQRSETAFPLPPPVRTAEGPIAVFDPDRPLYWQVAGGAR